MRRQQIVNDEYKKLWDKVWWNRHMSRCNSDHDPERIGCDVARAIEDKYGWEFLDPGNPVEWGITQGKMMGLAWAMGMDWVGSGDT